MIFPVAVIATIFVWAFVCFTAVPEEVAELGRVCAFVMAFAAVVWVLFWASGI